MVNHAGTECITAQCAMTHGHGKAISDSIQSKCRSQDRSHMCVYVCHADAAIYPSSTEIEHKYVYTVHHTAPLQV